MKSSYKRLGDYIHEVNNRNKELNKIPLLGVSITKKFISSIANIVGTDMSTYKLIAKNQFAYGPVTSRNGDKISIALSDEHENAMVSQAYTVFDVNDANEVLPEYLMMWFRRTEFDRYCRFKSHGSAREIFDWNEMCDILLPIPSPEKQREIVKEYHVIQNRIALNNQLIGKLEETAQTIYKQWFDIQEDSEKIKINELVETQYGFTETASTDIIGPKFLRITDIAQKNIDWKNVPYCKISQNDFEKYRLSPGDIVVARTGATAGFGKRLHKIFSDCVFASFLVRLTPKEPKWSLFLGLTVDSSEYRDYILANAEGSAQPQANATLLASFEINKPDESVILEFNRIIEPLFDSTENFHLQNQKLNELNYLLLSRMTKVDNGILV
jgi:type I restriction enzyme S subunit